MPHNDAHKVIRVDVVAFQDPKGIWIGQGIQYDIVAHARSPIGLREAFTRQLAANLALNRRLGREGLDGVPPAPDRFRTMFEKAADQLTSLAPPPKLTRRIREEIDIRLTETA